MSPNRTPRVAVIGAGFTGCLTAAQLLRAAKTPLEIRLIERRPPFGAGVAFQTTLQSHVLNVPVARMSAYPEDPDHLLSWLGRTPGAEGFAIKNAFLPRRLYGEYVERTLEAAGEDSPGRLTRSVGEVVDVETTPSSGSTAAESPARLQMADGSSLEAEIVVLAIGNPAPTDPLRNGAMRSSPRYATDPWSPSVLVNIGREDPIVVLGSNLTMVDVVLALDAQGHRGSIVAISTHGLLPRPHRENILPAWTLRDDVATAGPRALLRSLREEIERAAAEGADWRQAVDALRPRIVSLWTSWPERERRRFLRHSRPYWEVHRHRMAPENARVIDRLLGSGRLRVVAGRILEARESGDGIELEVRVRRTGRTETFRAARVVNCTGPGLDFRRARDPLIASLLARGLARPGPLGLGFDVNEHHALLRADGQPSSTLFTLGPPLKGRYWETTAVPEIREQARTLAQFLLGTRS